MSTVPEQLTTSPKKLKTIWNQRNTPVVLRSGRMGERLKVRLPFSEDNRSWLQNEQRLAPVWITGGRYWEIPKAWFDAFVDRALERFTAVYILQPYRAHEKCAPACRNATGHECQCSCMGAHHASENASGWFDVSETFALRWGEKTLACRKLTLAK